MKINIIVPVFKVEDYNRPYLENTLRQGNQRLRKPFSTI